jgi:glycine/D-amino acid oxidase-like deaminating enzyme/nitrite reductase/ring-hydroxylating ferredoxin subunit
MELPAQSRSIWSAASPRTGFPRLDGDVTVDVAVIGGGITGITAATLLKDAGCTVAVIEALRVGEGTTGDTTAHLTEAVDTRYATLIRDFGEAGARLVAESSRAAIDLIERLARERGLACDFRRVSGYLYAERGDVSELEAECEAARRVGCPASWTRDVPLPFETRAAVRFDHQARFHVLAYLRPLAAAIPGDGSHVFEQTRALDVVDAEPCRVVTERGTVTARHVIVATHVPVNNKVFLQTKVAHYRSYVVAARLREPVTDALFWDTDEPYHYARLQRVGAHDLLVVGGEDHKTGQRDDTGACYERLAEYARARYNVAAVDYRWSAQVIKPVDGLPYIGHNSLSTRVFVATGYAGNGMTFGTVAAMLLSDTILGRPNPWRHLYDATRLKPLASVRDFVGENVDFPAHLIADRFRRPEAYSLAEVARGEGKIVALGHERLAVYRDPRGGVHALSAVCTHLGCQVRFNNAETTWDCPCHGSRFATDGTVLNGPATRSLERRQPVDDQPARAAASRPDGPR